MPSFPLNLSQWQYRKRITISGSSGAGTNYQVLLKVGESSGASGAHFHLEGLSANFPSGKNQGGDLRFALPDGTLLDFWVEKVEGTSPNRVAYIWVEVAENLDTSKDIYCYFRNSSATNYSDPDRTFLLYDDFDSGSINPNKWEVFTQSGDTFTIDNGWLRYYTGGNCDYPRVRSKLQFNISLNYHISFKLKLSGGTYEGRMNACGFLNDFVSNTVTWPSIYLAIEHSWHIDGSIGLYRNGENGASYSISGFNPNQSYHFIITKFGNTYKWYRDGTLIAQDSQYSMPSQNVYFIFQKTGRDTGWYGWLDDLIIRKFADPEPAFSSAGPLEKRSSIIPMFFIR